MSVLENGDESEVLTVRVSPAEIAWLKRLELLTGDDPSQIIASMLRDIRIDDETAHGEGNGAERPRRH